MSQSTTTILRWLAVIPVAILAGCVVHFLLGTVCAIAAQFLSTSVTHYLRLLLCYAPKNAAFVFAGATLSPRPVPTAIVLATAAIVISLLTHIISQRTVGLTNYLHFAAETVGALLGVVAIYVAPRVLRPAKP